MKKGNNDNHQLVIAISIFCVIVLIGLAAKLFLLKDSADIQYQKKSVVDQPMTTQGSLLDHATAINIISNGIIESKTVPPTNNNSGGKLEETNIYTHEQDLSSDAATAVEPEWMVRYGQYRILANEYILPYSDSQYYFEEDLDQLTQEQLRIARNEIYARRGRKFKDESLQDYFEGCSWYKGAIDPDNFKDELFNIYENANKDLISQYEQTKGFR